MLQKVEMLEVKMKVLECVLGVKCITKGCINVRNALIIKMRKCDKIVQMRVKGFGMCTGSDAS